jgi:hypothetical protein
LKGNKYPTVNSWFWCFNVFVTPVALLHFRAINGKEFVTLNDLSATCLLILNTFGTSYAEPAWGDDRCFGESEFLIREDRKYDDSFEL